MLPVINTLARRVKHFEIGYGPIRLTGSYGLITLGVAAFIGSFLFAAALKWAGLACIVLGVATLVWPEDPSANAKKTPTA